MSLGAGCVGTASHHYMYAIVHQDPLYFRLPSSSRSLNGYKLLYRYGDRNENFVPIVLALSSLEPDGLQELLKGRGDTPVELVKVRQPLVRQLGVSGDGLQEPGGERGIDAVEELEKDQTEAIAVRQEPVASRAREFLDQALPAEFR